jgi:glucokinase
VILAGDIGGTKTALGLFTLEDGALRACAIAEYASCEHAGLAAVVAHFLTTPPARSAAQALRAAGFGIAGPVLERRVAATNLPWVVDAGDLERRLGVPVHLLNDLAAMGAGIAELAPGDFAVLQPGPEAPAAAAVLVAAGTGLGEAILVPAASGRVPLASEGGHADLAARNEEEIALLRFLIARYGRADYEHVLSGPGLLNCYRFTHEDTGVVARGATAGPAPHGDLLAAADPAAAVSASALAGTCSRCARSLGLFVSIYGAEAGNLALKAMAMGGVYVGGGIAPKILPALADGRFIAAFRAKGEPFASLLARIPVRVILNRETALRGAARAAARG